mmetsp:Transcript_48399/g.117174  ORF Transcript_48399/g.117174 Transcript_48399/m.117174 type:complete len:282 (-) Transcript_48399:156-1001(-)
MMNTLDRNNWTGSFVHGTNGKALQGINSEEYDGKLITSDPDYGKSGTRHDFGRGVYTMKGDFVQALAWGIDSISPIFNVETWSFDSPEPWFVSAHNPALVVFPMELQPEEIYKVDQRPPFTEEELKAKFRKRRKYDEYDSFVLKQREYKEDCSWKTFVKLARYYGIIPTLNHRQSAYAGRFHDVSTVNATDKCEMPKMDPDKNYIQYCFPDQEELCSERIFIEFDIDWNEWLSEATPPRPALLQTQEGETTPILNRNGRISHKERRRLKKKERRRRRKQKR